MCPENVTRVVEKEPPFWSPSALMEKLDIDTISEEKQKQQQRRRRRQQGEKEEGEVEEVEENEEKQ